MGVVLASISLLSGCGTPAVTQPPRPHIVQGSPVYRIVRVYEKNKKHFIDTQHVADIFSEKNDDAHKAAVEDYRCSERIDYHDGFVFDDCAAISGGIYTRNLTPTTSTLELISNAEIRLPIPYQSGFNGMEFVTFAKLKDTFSTSSLAVYDWTKLPFHFVIKEGKITELWKVLAPFINGMSND